MPADIRQVEDQVSNFRNVPLDATAEALKKFLVDQPQEKKKEAIQQFTAAISAAGSSISPPDDPHTRNMLWMIVIVTFSIVLIGSFIALVVGVFVPPAKGGVTPELLFAMFTSVVGFLAGLFVPSPAANRGQSDNG